MNQSDKVIKVHLEEAWSVMSEQLAAGGTVCFSPKGTSMLPMLRQGVDTVVLSRAPEALKKYDLPLYKRDSGQFVLHRVVGVRSDGYVMCGDNQTSREYGIDHSQILAIATGFYRGDEYIDCTDSRYISYCRKRVLKKQLHGLLVKLGQFLGR